VFDPDLDRFAALPEDSTTQGALVDEDMYDDEQDHTRCTDCNGSGYYVGFTERRTCPTCDGSGYL
jgi:DnaJ-class molecular chaperone